MEGLIVSHYRILAHLARGGMGVVYSAEDIRLKRRVALKFLPPDLTRADEDEARQRFVQEAQAASALDHPNICTIYEIGEADNGQLFIAMAYYEGETLKERLQRGPLPVADALDVAIQIARGLDKAHDAGILHRDIKPPNLMLTQDGLVKILDFGVAKLVDGTGLTRTGTTPGTVAYMSPEQVNGAAVDQRSDIWAAGVVLYEMVTGRAPFAGEHQVAILNNVLNQVPTPVSALRPDVPGDIDRVILRALAKRPEERYSSSAALLEDLTRCQATIAGQGAATAKSPIARRTKQRFAVAAGVAALILVGIPAGWLVQRTAEARRVDEGIVDASSLANSDRFTAALARAEDVERIRPDDPRLPAFLERVSRQLAISSDPAGADVYVRPFDDMEGTWRHVGRTPIAHVRLPLGMLRWKVQKDGFDTLEFIRGSGFFGFFPVAREHVQLRKQSALPQMVLVPAANLTIPFLGQTESDGVPAGEYLLDKYEVSNRLFKEFVEAGGYTKREYWTQPFVKGGKTVSWEQAMADFRDRTGRAGPSTWEVGTYPPGQDDYPVSGVSWYEAAAYAEFRGKSLPTVYHWFQAASLFAAAYITPLSNVEGKGLAPVGSHPGVTFAGAFDMAGNVREWCWNEVASSSLRYILGGSWADPRYIFHSDPVARAPFDRSETNGFRLVDYLDAKRLAPALMKPVEVRSRDYRKEKPASEEVFQVYRQFFAYEPRPLDAKIESVDAAAEHWTRERITFRAAYGDERVIAYLFLPKHGRPPYQTVVHFPSAGAIYTLSSATLPMSTIDFLLFSGRAVLYPIPKGTFERQASVASTPVRPTLAHRDWKIQYINDIRRSVDFLKTRSDINGDLLAYYGLSWGAANGANVLAVESRFKAGVLVVGGYFQNRWLPEVEQLHFAPRVKAPVLMINAESDLTFPLETSQKPMFAHLGTPPEHKRHVLFPGGHDMFIQRRSQVVKEALDWLDRYLGPVQR